VRGLRKGVILSQYRTPLRGTASARQAFADDDVKQAGA